MLDSRSRAPAGVTPAEAPPAGTSFTAVAAQLLILQSIQRVNTSKLLYMGFLMAVPNTRQLIVPSPWIKTVGRRASGLIHRITRPVQGPVPPRLYHRQYMPTWLQAK